MDVYVLAEPQVISMEERLGAVEKLAVYRGVRCRAQHARRRKDSMGRMRLTCKSIPCWNAQN